MRSVNYDTLAGWWCAFNCWKWPEELTDMESEFDFDAKGRRAALMAHIEYRIGTKRCTEKWRDVIETERKRKGVQ